MYNRKSIIFLAGAALMMVSCGLLEVDNPSGIYGSNYWQTKGEVESYLTGTYTSFRDCCNSLENFEARGDALIAGLEGSGSDRWAQNLTALNGISWASYYTVVQHCNMILKNIGQVEYTLESEKNEVLAEVYTIRAYMYFCLVRLWGDVPLELEPTEGYEKPLPYREPKEAVMSQILQDIDTAIDLFPTDSWSEGKSKASKKAAYALKADALLWRAKVLGGGAEDLQDVLDYADLAAEGTSLETNFEDIYNTNSRNGSEVIWSIHFGYPEIDGNYTHYLTLRDQFVKTAVNMEDIPYAISGARSDYYPSDELRALMATYENDVRNSNAYIEAYSSDGSVLGVSQNKMVGTKTETNRIYDDDIILYRGAEMILFKAEALAALGRVSEAIEQLNLVRERAGIGTYSGATDQISVEKEILDERGREFWLEDKRWPDLLRFHYEGVINVYEVVPNLRSRYEVEVIVPLYFAIPLSELSLNHNLTQTEGYE